LRDLAAKHNKLIGSCFAPSHLSDSNYGNILGQQFSVITPENEMKWAATEPNRNQFTYSQGDSVVNFANSHNQKVRGHNLAWGEGNPSWLTNGNFNASTKQEILKNHISNVAGHFKGKVICWDVVNEAVSDNPNPSQPLKDNVWYPSVPNYIDLAFQWASQTDPGAKLFYNDYGAEAAGSAKSDAVYNLVKGMKQRGIPIHGVGLQYHVSISYQPNINAVHTNIQRLIDLGLEVHITELDVSTNGQASASAFQSQANVYSSVIKACLSFDKCTAFVSWGFTDKYTWLNSNNALALA
jgi:endo-1,4-beta-xylanase